MVEFLTIKDMDQLVNFLMHVHGNNLDWIMCISPSNITNITNITERDFLLDHNTTDITLTVQK